MSLVPTYFLIQGRNERHLVTEKTTEQGNLAECIKSLLSIPHRRVVLDVCVGTVGNSRSDNKAQILGQSCKCRLENRYHSSRPDPRDLGV